MGTAFVTPHTPAVGPGEAHGPGQPRSLRLLTGFELRVGGALVPLPVNVQRVVAFLAVRERPQLRTAVSTTLWMDACEARAAANLRTALWRLRRLDDDLVVVTGGYVALAEQLEVDLSTLTRRARRLINPTIEQLDELEPADTQSLTGDLLPHWDEDWVLFERERLRQLRVHALEALCARLTCSGRYGEAVDAGQAAVAAEPLRESAHRCLIQAHLAERNVGEARRQYALCRSILRDNLGIDPSIEVTELVAGVGAAR